MLYQEKEENENISNIWNKIYQSKLEVMVSSIEKV